MRAHVDPGLRHGDDDVGVAEAERRQQLDRCVGIGDALADEVLAGDAEMGAARRRAGRTISEAERNSTSTSGTPAMRAAIVARAARLATSASPARAKNAAAFSCRRPFEGTARIRGGPARAHRRRSRDAVEPERAADGRNRRRRAEVLQQPVVAAAADDRLAVGAPRIVRPRR